MTSRRGQWFVGGRAYSMSTGRGGMRPSPAFNYLRFPLHETWTYTIREWYWREGLRKVEELVTLLVKKTCLKVGLCWRTEHYHSCNDVLLTGMSDRSEQAGSLYRFLCAYCTRLMSTYEEDSLWQKVDPILLCAIQSQECHYYKVAVFILPGGQNFTISWTNLRQPTCFIVKIPIRYI
jgi:hypothetical protein